MFIPTKQNEANIFLSVQLAQTHFDTGPESKRMLFFPTLSTQSLPCLFKDSTHALLFPLLRMQLRVELGHFASQIGASEHAKTKQRRCLGRLEGEV